MKSPIYKPPSPLSLSQERLSVFLAGSIEMGAAEDWQETLCILLSNLDVDIYNPRREDWDSSWEQRADNPKFREQVEWELKALEECDLIFLNLIPGTISPISLLELGLYAQDEKGRSVATKLVVRCPEGFHRKGNVDIVCQRYNVTQVATYEEFVDIVRHRQGEHK